MSILFMFVLCLFGLIGGVALLILNAIRLIGKIIAKAALLGIFIYAVFIIVDIAVAITAFFALSTWLWPAMLL